MEDISLAERNVMQSTSERQSYLFVLPWSIEHLGGVTQVVINLARQMLRSGSFDPIVLIADWKATEPVWAMVHGIQTIRWRLRPYGPNMSLSQRIAHAVWERRFGKTLASFCRLQRVAAINVHYPGPSTISLERITRNSDPKIPLILSFHGSDLGNLQNALPAETSLWQELLRRVRKVIVCSDDLGKRFTGIFGASTVPLVIHNGLDIDAFEALAGEATPPTHRSILNVGQFVKKKGQDALIEAFVEICEDYPDVKLVIVGASDRFLPTIQDLRVRSGLQERIDIHADVPHIQVAGFFQRASIFALPSREEAFGIVLLEAAAFALPVVASRVGGVPEILTDGETAKLVDPANPQQLAQVLRFLLDHPESARQMGAALKRHIRANFTWTVAHERYVELIQPRPAALN
jgi:glycosyltransferase involved in cell wall biosynthesis